MTLEKLNELKANVKKLSTEVKKETKKVYGMREELDDESIETLLDVIGRK